MANTYIKIATVTVGAGGASTIDFTSIPQTYTDLVLKISSRTNQSQIYGDVSVNFNGVSTNQSGRGLQGTGAAAGSGPSTRLQVATGTGASATANTFANSELYIPNYTGSTNKSMSADAAGENNATTAYTDLIASLWSSTAAITSISIYTSSTFSFVQYSSATLYGISKS